MMFKTILNIFSSSEPTSEILIESSVCSSANVNSNIDHDLNEINHLADSRKAEFKIWQGVKLEKQGQIEKAIALYRQAVDIEPQSVEAHQILAAALKKQNQVAASAFHYAQAAKFEGDNIASQNIKNKFLTSWEMKYADKANNQTELQLSTPANSDLPIQVSKTEQPGDCSHQARKLQLEENNYCSSQVTKLQLEENNYCSNQATKLQTSEGDNNANYRENLDDRKTNLTVLVTQINDANSLVNSAITHTKKTTLAETTSLASSSSLSMQQQNGATVLPSLKTTKIWEEFGKDDKALDCFFRALELEPNILDSQQHFQLAQKLETEGKLHKAIACYRYAVDLDPNFRYAYLRLAKALEQNGQFHETGIYYREIARIDSEPDNGDDKSTNKKRISRLLESSPKVRNQIHKNNSIKQLKEEREIQARTKLLAQNSTTYTEIHGRERKKKQTSISKTDLAIQQYLQRAKLEPTSAVVQTNLGSLYAKKQDWQKAIAHYSKAIQFAPDAAIGYRNLAEVYIKIGEPNKATELLYQAYSIESSNISGTEHWQLGEILRQQNQRQKAIACYRRAIKCQPDFTDAYLSLGTILDSQNNQKDAIACYKQAIKYSPENAQAYLLLGQLYTKEEQWQQATNCYQQVIKLQSHDSDALHQLEDVLAKQKNKYLTFKEASDFDC